MRHFVKMQQFQKADTENMKQLTREERCDRVLLKRSSCVCIDMGAEAVKALLSELDLEALNAGARRVEHCQWST